MPSYAQTNIALFKQLINAGYSQEDLTSIVKAYDLAIHLFPFNFTPSGKVHIAK